MALGNYSIRIVLFTSIHYIKRDRSRSNTPVQNHSVVLDSVDNPLGEGTGEE
jgi:hypothetical protein